MTVAETQLPLENPVIPAANLYSLNFCFIWFIYRRIVVCKLNHRHLPIHSYVHRT